MGRPFALRGMGTGAALVAAPYGGRARSLSSPLLIEAPDQAKDLIALIARDVSIAGIAAFIQFNCSAKDEIAACVILLEGEAGGRRCGNPGSDLVSSIGKHAAVLAFASGSFAIMRSVINRHAIRANPAEVIPVPVKKGCENRRAVGGGATVTFEYVSLAASACKNMMDRSAPALIYTQIIPGRHGLRLPSDILR